MTATFKNVQVIVNPASGGNEPILNTINDVFGRHGIRWDARVTHEAGDATELARQAADAGCDLVVSYGGDGTLMEVVNGLMGTGTRVGILPGGTGNAVAAELGIPPNLADALNIIATSERCRHLDVGKIDERYFLLRAFSGISEEYVASRSLKDRLGPLAYPVSALRFLKENTPTRYIITVDGERVEVEALMCYVNNIAYSSAPRLQDWVEKVFLDVRVHGDATPPEEQALHLIDPSDGLLDVVLLTQNPFSLRALRSVIVGDGDEQATVHLFQGKHVELVADPPQPLWIDGEECGRTPAEIQVVAGAVEVIVPNPTPTSTAA